MNTLRVWIGKTILVNWSGVNRLGATTSAKIVQIDEYRNCAPQIWVTHEMSGDVRLVIWDGYYFEWVNTHIGKPRGESEGERAFTAMRTAREHWQRAIAQWGDDHPIAREYRIVYDQRKCDVFKTPVWVRHYGEFILESSPLLTHPPAL